MENASKALLMAAGVLIGMLVISLAVYLIVSFGMTSAEIHKDRDKQQLEQFNAQFISYVGREDITIYDIVTVANLASENNIYYELTNQIANGEDNYVSVQMQSQGYIEKAYNNTRNIDYEELIKADINNMEGNQLKKYNCQVEISNTTRTSLQSYFYEEKDVKMKKLAIFFLIVLMIVVGMFYLYFNYKVNYYEAKRANNEFESYLNQEIYGSELATIMNKAIDNNQKNEVEKDKKGKYIDNEKNSIKIEIQMLDNKKKYDMETLNSGEMAKFVQFYNQIKFKCTKLDYHKTTNKVKYLLFEQITE